MNLKKELAKNSNKQTDKNNDQFVSTNSNTNIGTSSSQIVQPKIVDDLTRQLANLLFQVKKSELKGKAITVQLQEQITLLTSELQKSESKFLGLLGKCYLAGNDCHMLDPGLEIAEHFVRSSPVPDGFEKARCMISFMPPNVVGLLVYNFQIQYLYLDGTTQAVE